MLFINIEMDWSVAQNKWFICRMLHDMIFVDDRLAYIQNFHQIVSWHSTLNPDNLAISFCSNYRAQQSILIEFFSNNKNKRNDFKIGISCILSRLSLESIRLPSFRYAFVFAFRLLMLSVPFAEISIRYLVKSMTLTDFCI